METVTSTPTYDETFAPLSITQATFKNTPEEYQKLVIRLISIQAYAEKVAAIGVPDWSRKAPDFRAVRTLGKIIADEARHAFLLYIELENLGVSEKQADAIATGKESGSASLDGPGALDDNDLGWLDMIMNHMFLDRAGKFMVTNFTKTSYEPWAIACEKIAKDEDMHVAFGMTEFKKWVKQEENNPDLAKIISRWFAAGLNFFGPPPGKSQKLLERYGIKPKNNDVLREEFRAEIMAIMADIGRTDLIQLKPGGYPNESIYGEGAPAAR